MVCEKSFAHKHLLARHNRTHSSVVECEVDDTCLPATPTLTEQILQPAPDVIEMLTGYSYNLHALDNGLMHLCPTSGESGCKERFKRKYDAYRHVESTHSDDIHIL